MTPHLLERYVNQSLMNWHKEQTMISVEKTDIQGYMKNIPLLCFLGEGYFLLMAKEGILGVFENNSCI